MSIFRTLQIATLSLLPVCMVLPIEAVGAMNPSIQVLSATVKDKPIPGAEVIFQKNGQNSVATRTDANGKAVVSTSFGVDDSSVLLIIKAPGYSTLVVKCPCDGLTYALSETMTQLDGMRIVLTWGGRPNDLDSHLVFADSHIYFNRKFDGNHARLDIDSRSGYGPETITIDQRLAGVRYLYAVHTFGDYEAAGETPAQYDTQAKVQVYIGRSLVRTYYFFPKKVDTLLYLFGINEQGEIYDINKDQEDVRGEDAVTRALYTTLSGRVYVASDTTNPLDIDHATRLNHQGEAAYRRQDLESAIDFYRQAIEIYPGYGQAYSNLGLAYQKSGRIAEALWANRKAIVVANGDKKNVVRASSYYNIARIYETNSLWASALQNYKWAEQQHHNDVYQAGIDRMRVKSGFQ